MLFFPVVTHWVLLEPFVWDCLGWHLLEHRQLTSIYTIEENDSPSTHQLSIALERVDPQKFLPDLWWAIVKPSSVEVRAAVYWWLQWLMLCLGTLFPKTLVFIVLTPSLFWSLGGVIQMSCLRLKSPILILSICLVTHFCINFYLLPQEDSVTWLKVAPVYMYKHKHLEDSLTMSV